jgi:KDO2-lipid IV(A) lauroyltransferase
MKLRARSAVTLPRRMLAAALAFVAFRLVRVRRAHVEASLRRAGLSGALGVYQELATSLTELLWVSFGWLTPSDVVKIPADTAREIAAAREHGPVMLFCAHTSNWELVAMQAASLFPLSVIVKTQSVGAADRFAMRLRARFGVGTIGTAGAAQATRSAHARGDVVATVIDQVPGRSVHGNVMPFLSAPALVDRSPAVLAKRAGAQVFVIFAAREHGRVQTRLVVTLDRQMVQRLPARDLMATATAALDAHVRAFPSSWLWLHRRWKFLPAPLEKNSGGAFHAPENAVTVDT